MLVTFISKFKVAELPRVPFLNCCQFMYLVIYLLVLRAGYGIWLYQFLIIAYRFTLSGSSCLLLHLAQWQFRVDPAI